MGHKSRKWLRSGFDELRKAMELQGVDWAEVERRVRQERLVLLEEASGMSQAGWEKFLARAGAGG